MSTVVLRLPLFTREYHTMHFTRTCVCVVNPCVCVFVHDSMCVVCVCLCVTVCVLCVCV